jgi:hypothetical protein
MAYRSLPTLEREDRKTNHDDNDKNSDEVGGEDF